MDAVSSALWQAAQFDLRRDPLRAQAACEQLLAREPGFWGVHWMLGRLHQAQRKMRRAVAHARESARCLTSDSRSHDILMVSSGLIACGQYEACAALLARVTPAMGLDPMQVGGIIEQHMMLDDPASALHWLDVAAAAGVRGAALSVTRGNAEKFLGRIEAAESAYEDALRLDPAQADAHFALASLGIAAGRRQRIDRLRAIVSRQRDEGIALATLSYALFKELDHEGDTAQAWPHLQRAMAIRSATGHYDAGVDNAIFDQMLSATRLEPGHDGTVNDARVPLFIIGLPRSGTTLVERILGNHADVINCGELSELRMAYKWASDDFCNGFLDPPAARRLASTDPRVVGDLYLASTRWRVGTHRWHTDKHPGNLLLAGVALAGLPSAKLVHVRKQPMDACFSCLREMFVPGYYEYSYAFDDMANHYRNVDRWTRRLHEDAGDRILDVQYEDLVVDPEGTAERLLAFCGLPPQSGLQDVTANRSPVTTASSVQVRSPIHSGRIAYWRRYASQLQRLQEKLEQFQIG